MGRSKQKGCRESCPGSILPRKTEFTTSQDLAPTPIPALEEPGLRRSVGQRTSPQGQSRTELWVFSSREPPGLATRAASQEARLHS